MLLGNTGNNLLSFQAEALMVFIQHFTEEKQ